MVSGQGQRNLAAAARLLVRQAGIPSGGKDLGFR